MSEPRTAAGRALLDTCRETGFDAEGDTAWWRDRILAIEAEAADALLAALRACEYGLNLAIEQRPDWQEEAQEALNTARALLRDLSPEEEPQ